MPGRELPYQSQFLLISLTFCGKDKIDALRIESLLQSLHDKLRTFIESKKCMKVNSRSN